MLRCFKLDWFIQQTCFGWIRSDQVVLSCFWSTHMWMVHLSLFDCISDCDNVFEVVGIEVHFFANLEANWQDQLTLPIFALIRTHAWMQLIFPPFLLQWRVELTHPHSHAHGSDLLSHSLGTRCNWFGKLKWLFFFAPYDLVVCGIGIRKRCVSYELSTIQFFLVAR